MHPRASTISIALLVAAILLPFASVSKLLATDAIEGRGELVATIPVPADLTAPQVTEAIVNTLIGRQWGVKSRDGDAVVGYLKHRSNEAKVTLTFDSSNVQLYCIGWQIDKKTGVREKPELPKGWLKNIQADLVKNFNRAATLK
jgi:hypothetical protein